MDARRLFFVVIVLMVCSVGFCAGGGDVGYASCLLKITGDSSGISGNPQSLSSLVRSSGVAGKAAREVMPDVAIGNLRNIRVEMINTSSRRTTARPNYSLIELSITLSGIDTLSAEKYLNAVIENLAGELENVYHRQLELVEVQLDQARSDRAKIAAVVEETEGKTDEDRAIEKVLETRVDLSEFKNETSLVDALEMIRKSVDPPLKLIVMWSDLSNSAFIEQDTSIGCDGKGMYDIKLGNALKWVLKGVGGGLSMVAYTIKDGLISVSTVEDIDSYDLGFFGSPNPGCMSVSSYYEDDYKNIPVETLMARKGPLFEKLSDVQIELSRDRGHLGRIRVNMEPSEFEMERLFEEDGVCLSMGALIKDTETQIARMEGNEPMSEVLTLLREKLVDQHIALDDRKNTLISLNREEVSEELKREQIRYEIIVAEGESVKSNILHQLELIDRQIKKAEIFSKEQQIKQSLEQIEERIRRLEGEKGLLSGPHVMVIGGVSDPALPL